MKKFESRAYVVMRQSVLSHDADGIPMLGQIIEVDIWSSPPVAQSHMYNDEVFTILFETGSGWFDEPGNYFQEARDRAVEIIDNPLSHYYWAKRFVSGTLEDREWKYKRAQ